MRYYTSILAVIFLFVTACNKTIETKNSEEQTSHEFKGKIAKTYEESIEYWPKKTRPPKDAPNIIIFLLDDVGFAQVASFGSLIDTTNIDVLAANGSTFEFTGELDRVVITLFD